MAKEEPDTLAGVVALCGWTPAVGFVPRTFRCVVCGVDVGKAYARSGPTLCQTHKDSAAELAREKRLRPARATIPERFQWTLGRDMKKLVDERVGFASDDDAVAARKVVQALLSAVITGPTGSGKTSLACIALARYIERERDVARAATARYCRAPELARATRQHPLGEGEAPLVVDCMRASLLVLDHVGDTIAGDNPISYVLLRRHERGAPTIVTTWLPDAELRKRYGDPFVDKAHDGAQVIRLRKPDG